MTKAIAVLLLTLAFAAGPFLFPDFTGFDPDSFPVPQDAPPVQPVGYAFAIWGPIYLWLVLSAVWGVWKRAADLDWAPMRPALAISMTLGAVWLPVAQTDPLAAAVLLWAMWLAAIVALFRAPRDDRLLAAWPLGLYAGWLSAASCVALGLVLAGYDLIGAQPAALAMVGLAAAVAAAVQLRLKRTPTFGLAVVWALAGIVIANASDNAQVSGLAAGGAIGICALTILNTVQEVRRGV